MIYLVCKIDKAETPQSELMTLVVLEDIEDAREIKQMCLDQELKGDFRIFQEVE